jgi:hypothetical protein
MATIASRVGRMERLNRCPTCGMSVVETREMLVLTLNRIEKSVPEDAIKQLMADLRRIWTRS